MEFFVFKFKNHKVTRMPGWKVPTAVEFSIHSLHDITYIVIRATDGYYSGVWEFDGKHLEQIQNIDFAHATDMKIWTVGNEMHMAVSSIENYHSKLEKNISRNYNETVIYRWSRTYMDPIQIIEERVSKLMVFSAENDHFIALIFNNTKNDFSAEYSEIYRYNFKTSQYEIHQRIPTHNCKDIQFFALKKRKGYDSYLVVANYGSGESVNEIPPIIYRYVDGYFLPFQNLQVENILEFEPIHTPEDAFLLIARTEFQSLKTFQYDGWTFQESSHDINKNLPKVGTVIAKPFVVENVTVLVVKFPTNDDMLEIYTIDFLHENQLENFHKQILTWCESSLKQLEMKRNESVRGKRETQIAGQNIIENTDSSEEIRRNIVIADLLLEELENQAVNSLQKNGTHTFENLEAEEIILQDSKIHSLSTETINGEIIDEILVNSIDINGDTPWTNRLVLEHVQIDSNISPHIINGRKADDMINIHDDIEINQLSIIGKMIADSVTTQTLNNIPFDKENILLKNMDQKFSNFEIENLQVEMLNPENINNRNMINLEVGTKSDHKIDRVSRLKTKKIVIGEFINNVDMRTLDNYSLRIVGDQEITQKYFFENLQANNMIIEELSGKNVENFVRIDSGQYKIEQDVQFTNYLTVNDLEVHEVLDLIPVVNGKLQILLKDFGEVQYISAKKTLDEVEVLNTIEIRGNIKSEELEKLNPVKNVNEPLILEGDFEISGNTTIENLVKTGDIITQEGILSAKRVLSHGLLLREKEINIHLNFQQQLNVDEIFIDNVNGINPQTWVVTGTNNKQVIHGPKVFVDDVVITGDTEFFKINNIDVSDLEHSVMRIHGNQSISGKHTVLNVVAGSVTGNNITLGSSSFQNVLTTSTEQFILGTTVINGECTSNISNSKETEVMGTTNGFNFSDLLLDTVMKNKEKPIIGHKSFKNFTATNLTVLGLETSNRNKMIYDGDVTWDNATVENIHFMKSCNDIERDSFGMPSLEDIPVEIVSQLTDLESLIVHGNVYIDSGFLNDVHLENFERETVKIDEENVFRNVIFERSVFSEAPVLLQGQVEKVELENLVPSKAEQLQMIQGIKTFENMVFVQGNVVLEGLVNDFDLNDMCNFADPEKMGKELTIEGNAIFVKGPHVQNLFNTSIQHILDNAWFKDREVVLKESLLFENVTLYNNTIVKGTVDGVNLGTLKNEYFSKTKDQTIDAEIHIANHATFSGNLISPKMSLEGTINGIKIPELLRTILLQDEDQVFEEVVYLEDVYINDLQGEFLVNNLMLETDLLRYDKENIITGHKHLDYLNAYNVKLKENITIQNVDILNWMRNAILKKGIFNIDKLKIFKQNVHFERGISLQGLMNGEKFTDETIMLKNTPQNITGEKSFKLDKFDLMHFKNMKLRGQLNDMQMSEFLSENNDENLIFDSPIYFQKDLYTKNLNLKKSYKDINMDEVLSDIFQLESMDDLMENYGKLLNLSQKINKNLREQAVYLQYYRDLQEIKNPKYIVNFCCDNQALMYFDLVNGSYLRGFYHWNEQQQIFSKSFEITVDKGYPPVRTLAFSFGRQQFLYMEYPKAESKTQDSFEGTFWKIDMSNQLINYGSIKSNGVDQITPFTINDSECLLIIYQKKQFPNILCNLNTPHEITLRPFLHSGHYIQSRATKINDVPFLIMVQSNDETSINAQAYIEIWRIHDSQFTLHQVLYFSDPPPKSIATITYKGVHYLAIVYQGGFQQGHVDILRYSPVMNKYEQWQKITSNNPENAEFSVVPSGELLLFLLGSSNESLMIYKYEGISGFRKHITIANIPAITRFSQFTMDKNHFIMVEYGGKLRILQAQFKGNLKESL
ncbi:hypothetical protein HHI36_011443 [Cryptolaemus montrouzieri]|uniref:Uncharacterized protein n=2 Tax=Cryptolaemus montrouzieri TaxID=559131 RepID=A0ABD2MLS5_9CUCU